MYSFNEHPAYNNCVGILVAGVEAAAVAESTTSVTKGMLAMSRIKG